MAEIHESPQAPDPPDGDADVDADVVEPEVAAEESAEAALEAALEAEVAHLPDPIPEPIPPWEQQAGETSWAFHAFTHFRDQKVHSCLNAYKTHKAECMGMPVGHLTDAPKHWRLWSSQWDWVERARAWDAELDRLVRERLVSAQVEARERHARFAQAMLTVLSLPVKAALEAARDPNLVPTMTAAATTAAGAKDLIAQVARIAAAVPAVVNMERLALGLTTESVHVEDTRDEGISFADRIANDPAATELAIQLLDQLTLPRASTALGAGVSGEPGDVADSPAPQPPDPEAG